MSTYKTITTRGSLGSLIDSGDVESLRDEMEEWRDNMSGTGLENTSKFDEVSECADALETIANSFDTAATTLVLDNDVVGLLEDEITYNFLSPRKKRPTARWARAANAASAINAALDHIESKLSEDDVPEEVSELRDLAEELQVLDFPRMF